MTGLRTIALALLLAGASAAGAQSPEPPPEAAEGDYTYELADTLAEGDLETRWSANGSSGSAPRRAQSVRFRASGSQGRVRDGDDALAGGVLDTDAAGGRLRVGRLAPRWGRGLVLGAAAEPWKRDADDRGDRGPYRGRAGEGLSFAHAHGIEGVAGRFSKRRLAGALARRGPWGAGVLVADRMRQGSLGLEADAWAGELAGDARGRWRGELLARGRSGALSLSLRARGGSAAFRSVAEPLRSGPARAEAALAEWDLGAHRLRLHTSWWRFAAGAAGRRGALELDGRMGEHGSFVVGVEEQHGARREGESRPPGLRQGLWGAWRARSGPLELALRHELWGARPFAREAVRRSLAAKVETRPVAGVSWFVSHALWRVRSGERLHLPEADGDRLTLRSLTGEGERTRVELRAPVLGGRLRLGLTTTLSATRTIRPQWRAEWSRRNRP